MNLFDEVASTVSHDGVIVEFQQEAARIGETRPPPGWPSQGILEAGNFLWMAIPFLSQLVTLVEIPISTQDGHVV